MKESQTFRIFPRDVFWLRMLLPAKYNEFVIVQTVMRVSRKLT